MRAGYRRAKKMTMEQAFEEGKRKEQFMTSDGAVRAAEKMLTALRQA